MMFALKTPGNKMEKCKERQNSILLPGVFVMKRIQVSL